MAPTGNRIRYEGPRPRGCSCADKQVVLSVQLDVLGTNFSGRGALTRSLLSFQGPVSFGDGHGKAQTGPAPFAPQWSSFSSLATALGSWAGSFSLWKERQLSTSVIEWTPWEANSEAEVLAHGDFSAFNPELRIPVTASDLVWDVLPAALEAGRQAEHDFQHAKSKGSLPNRGLKQRKRNPDDKLRNTDPW